MGKAGQNADDDEDEDEEDEDGSEFVVEEDDEWEPDDDEDVEDDDADDDEWGDWDGQGDSGDASDSSDKKDKQNGWTQAEWDEWRAKKKKEWEEWDKEKEENEEKEEKEEKEKEDKEKAEKTPEKPKIEWKMAPRRQPAKKEEEEEEDSDLWETDSDEDPLPVARGRRDRKGKGKGKGKDAKGKGKDGKNKGGKGKDAKGRDGKGRDGKGRDSKAKSKAREKEKEKVKEKKGRGKGKKEKKRRGTVAEEAPEKLHGDDWEEPKEDAGLQLVKDMAPRQHKWSYPMQDHSRRSYAGFLPSPMSKKQCNTFFDRIKNGTKWLQPEGPMGPIPRKTAWMVKRGCTCTYRYGQIEVPPLEYPPWMLELMGVVMPCCGLKDRNDWPDSCNVNLYTDGGMSVGWHSDDEQLFQGKFRDILIISLSLGVKRKFELRLNWPDDDEKPVRRFMLGSGDLMTMEGMTQKHMQHRVPKEDNINGARINLTWRWVVKHTPKCPTCRRHRN